MRSALQQLRQTLVERFPEAMARPPAAGVLPTGLEQLDRQLPGGGLPRGHLVELEGALSSGKRTAVDRMAAALTVAGGRVALIDLPGTFYPPSMAASGGRLSRLLVARPTALPQALWACELLVRSQGFDLVVLDLTLLPSPRLAPAPLHRLARVAERGPSVVLLVTNTVATRVLPAGVTSLRIEARRTSTGFALRLVLNRLC